MTLTPPPLDARSQADLVREALRRLPMYAPEYTDHNESDPGRAIIEVNAWLVETLLYQINRVPDRTYLAFLDLIGVTPAAPRAARADLEVALKPLKASGDPLVIDVPLGTQVAVDAPDLDEAVTFETDASLRALNADWGLALVPEAGGLWRAVTDFDSAGTRRARWLHAFEPFGGTGGGGRPMVLGLVLRPQAKQSLPEDRMPAGPLDLYVEATEAPEAGPDGLPLDIAPTLVSGPLAGAPDAPPAVVWEVFTGGEAGDFTMDGTAGWQALNVTLDESAGLTRTGRVTVEMPGDVTGVSLSAAGAGTWAAMGRRKAPADAAALADVLRDPVVGEDLKAALTADDFAAMEAADAAGTLAACADALDLADRVDDMSELVPDALSQAAWAERSPAFAAPGAPTVPGAGGGPDVLLPLYFIRVRAAGEAGGRLLNRVRLNVVPATAASRLRDEHLGRSTGRPNQIVQLSRAPVYVDPVTGAPDLDLRVTPEGEAEEAWTRVDEFHVAGPTDAVFTLDPARGTITFGDGRTAGRGGRIPPLGARLRVEAYRVGGGRAGNVPADTITALKGALPGVAGVTNPRAAAGGADGETLEQVTARAPGALRRRERAVSAADFAELARGTPGAAIHAAYAVAAHVPGPTGFEPKPGAVSVVVLPATADARPLPSAAVLDAVRAHLDPRRLVSTELHITEPRYLDIVSLTALIGVAAGSDLSEVAGRARAAVEGFLHPVSGGADGLGWPFGTDLYHGDLYDLLLALPGVARVSRLQVRHEGPAVGAADVVEIPAGWLPALRPGAIGFETGYV